ncbi:hypothetical protein E1263_29720 [Kribbella antibiotica]|uniref:Uncharacterized protein n=1 Tax=Kribbella antibiotica TaxID=190195 RepID=A0A4R4Z1T5_9ACTN|nr:hypothetical protein [Kribbella antibiotica]TDD51875.1 hypothetical protein E1263_29720 [Kribbella antibiotica]
MDEQREREVKDAVAYVAAFKKQRPWLEPVSKCDPQVQRVYASLDLGLGHSHKRHAAFGDDTLQRRRVAYCEDPAQAHSRMRIMGFDGFKHDRQHVCGAEATRVHDATAFAAAFVVLTEHPEARRGLDTPAVGGRIPDAAKIPIADLLGSKGHDFCSGFALAGDWLDARLVRRRLTWARWTGEDLSEFAKPSVEQIPSFENGHFIVRFVPNSQTEAGGHQICTLTPEPERHVLQDPRLEVADRYWLHPAALPFTTVLNFMEKYIHPEIRFNNYHYLIRRVAIAAPDDEELATFKSELVQLLEGDHRGLHPHALSVASGYEDEGDDPQFLARLWKKLYPLEHVPGPVQG